MRKDTRRVQSTSSSTFTVSLLTEWANEVCISAGSEVNIRAIGDTMLVTPAREEDAGRTKSLSVGNSFSPLLASEKVRNAYVSGFDRVKIEVDSNGFVEYRDKIKHMVSELAGMTLVSGTDNEVILRDFTDGEKVLDRKVRDVFEASASAVSDCVDSFLSDSEEVHGSWCRRDPHTAVRRHSIRRLTDLNSLVNTEDPLVRYIFYLSCTDELRSVTEDAQLTMESPATGATIDDTENLRRISEDLREGIIKAGDVLVEEGHSYDVDEYSRIRGKFTEAGSVSEELRKRNTEPDERELLGFLTRTSRHGRRVADYLEQMRMASESV